MEAFVPLFWVVVLLLAVLCCAVLILYLNQRQYQRIDFSSLLNQEEDQRRLESRIAYLEQLIADLAEFEQFRRQELDELITGTRSALEDQVTQAKHAIVHELLKSPERMDTMLLDSAASATRGPASAPAAKAALLPNLKSTTANNPRQRQIAELLEDGFAENEVAYLLGISRHEVDLVSSIVFDPKLN